MTVSVLIPTYNRQAHVVRAVDSVLAQTAPVDEIIVIDDGSTDGTSEAIRRQYGPRVRVLQQENQGVSAARNYGIREARGEWIAFLDSDDFWLPTKIERQVEALTALGGGFGLCFTDNIFSGNSDLRQSMFQENGFSCVSKFGQLEEPATYILAEREPFYTSSLLVLRALLREPDNFDDAVVMREDTDLIFRLCFRTHFCFASESLVVVDRAPSRKDGLSDLMNSSRDDRKYDSLIRVYNKWLALPEVARSAYEDRVRELIREVYYDSVEAKIHELRIGPALREIGRLRSTGQTHASIVSTLFSRKVAKMRHRLAGADRTIMHPDAR